MFQAYRNSILVVCLSGALGTGPPIASAQTPSDATPRVRERPRSVVTSAVTYPAEIAPQQARGGDERRAAAPSQEPAVTLETLEDLALAHNPTLVQAAMRINAARAEWLQVGLPPNPVLGYTGDEIGNERTAGMQGVFVSQELVTAQKLRLNRGIACSEIEQAELAWETQRRRVQNDVRVGYYEVLAAQQAAQLNEQLVRLGTQGVKVAESLLAGKEVGRADVLQARVEADLARLQLPSARNRHEAAWRRLTALPNAKASLELVRNSYEHGEANYQTLLLTQRTYFQTSLAYLESLRELRASAVGLEGLLLTGALQAAP